ncbi:arabinofuranosyltransferase [Kineococcus aurantiacus]|uniref:Galactan 5-O-arabinofuranosyltransferase n=1 Tax=Kineococcus aurantiacus TaxID=37633 RepID=A0A7Y9J1R8_9ACTN|nr:galactan 5-O-arabinofuranosyltransferase [Kineococcus aurantiacus]
MAQDTRENGGTAGTDGDAATGARTGATVAVPATAARDAVVRGGFARLAGALALAAVAACAVSLLVQRVVTAVAGRLSGGDGWTSVTPSHVGTALVTALLVVVVAAVLAVCARTRWWRGTEAVAVVAVAGLATALLAVPLAGTSYYLGGNTNDQLFRTQLLGRLTDSWRLADMNYAGLPSFYPSGWFWLAGRFADLTGLQAWAAFKPAAIATSAVVPALALVAWSRLTGPRRGVLAGLATTAVGVYPALAGPFVDEPYSWCLAAFVPVVAVVAWRAFGDVPAPARRAAAVGIGVVLGAGAMTYTLYAGFAAFVVALCCAARSAQGWRAGQGWAAVRTRVPALVLAAVVSGLLALVVWAPYVLAVLRGAGGERAAAQHFLPLISAQLPAPMLAATPWGAFLLLGCAWLVLAVRRDPTARPLLLVVAVGYLWYLLSTVAIVARTTLLAFRMEAVLVETMAVAGVLGAAALWRALPRWGASARALTARPRTLEPRTPELRALAVLAAAAVFVVPLQATGQNLADQIGKAYTDYGPDGRTALGAHDETEAGAWTGDLLTAIDASAADLGVADDDLVVLSTYYEVFSFRPYLGYQQITAHYANPLADFDARREQVQDWARATSPADLLARLDSGPYAPPRVFVFRAGQDGYEVGLTRDVFPAEPNVAWSTAVFDPALFDDPAFTTQRVGPFVVVTRTGR